MSACFFHLVVILLAEIIKQNYGKRNNAHQWFAAYW